MMVAFVAIAFTVTQGPVAFDTTAYSWFLTHRTGMLTAVATAVSYATGPAGTAAVAVAAAVLIATTGKDRVGAVYVAAVAAVTGIAVLIAKNLVGRPRPPVSGQLLLETNGSFPSGHVAGAVAIYGAVAVYLAVRARSAGSRAVITVLTVAAVLLVAVDRLYLGVHWASDVLGSITAGSAILLTLTALWWDLRRSQAPAQEVASC